MTLENKYFYDLKFISLQKPEESTALWHDCISIQLQECALKKPLAKETPQRLFTRLQHHLISGGVWVIAMQMEQKELKMGALDKTIA